MNPKIISIPALEVRLSELDGEISNLKNKIAQLEKEREHIGYVIQNFSVEGTRSQASLDSFTEMSTKSLIIYILKENREVMRAADIWQKFHEIKPNISKNGFNGSLPVLALQGSKKPVKRLRVGMYQYDENKGATL